MPRAKLTESYIKSMPYLDRSNRGRTVRNLLWWRVGGGGSGVVVLVRPLPFLGRLDMDTRGRSHMNPLRTLPGAALSFVTTCLLASCGTTAAAQSQPVADGAAAGATVTAEYPAKLHGNWMPSDMACTTPINYDSDVLVVIGKDHLGHYEDANKPVSVQQLSSDPKVWSIKSLLNVGGDGYDTPVTEVFVLGGRQLAIVNDDGIKTYQKCN